MNKKINKAYKTVKRRITKDKSDIMGKIYTKMIKRHKEIWCRKLKDANSYT